MLRAPLRCLKQLLTAVIVVVVLLCLFEIGLRVYDSHTGQITRSDLYDQGFVAKSRSCYVELKPLLHVEVVPENGSAPFELQTNSLGLRGAEITLPKPPGTWRILCLGDERTAALDLPEAQTYCGHLQRYLQSRSSVPVEVWNAGVPGGCPLLSSLQFRQKLSGLQADLVLVNFDMSDVWDDYHLRPYTRLDRDNRPLACFHPLLDPPTTKRQQNWIDLFLVPQMTQRQLGQMWASGVSTPGTPEIDHPCGKCLWLQDQPPDWSRYIQHTFQPLVQIRDLAEGTYAECLITSAPAPWQVAATASNGEGVRAADGVPSGVVYSSQRPFELLHEFCAREQLHAVDAALEFQEHSRGAELFQQNSPNLSPLGHELYARVLASQILRSVRGPWSSSNAPTSPRSSSGTAVQQVSEVREYGDYDRP